MTTRRSICVYRSLSLRSWPIASQTLAAFSWASSHSKFWGITWQAPVTSCLRAGTARFASPLSALDFVKITSWIELDRRTSAELSPVAAELARAESLTAHAAAAQLRTEGEHV